MKFFKDPGLQDPIESVDLGIVPAGKSQKVTVYVKNDLPRAELVDLKFSAESCEVQGPTTLKPGESAPVNVTWTPTLTLRQPLKTSLIVKGVEIYRPGRG